MEPLLFFAIALLISFIMGEIFFRLGYPRIIGQILTGIIFAIPFLTHLVTPETRIGIGFLADLAIVFLLLLAGMEVDLTKFRRHEKETFIVSAFSVAIPFVLGFVLIKAIGYDTSVAAIVGAALSLTAEGTTLAALIDIDAIKTRLGGVILGAGILDDIFELLFLGLVLVIANETARTLLLFPARLLLFIGLIFMIYKFLPKFMSFVHKEHNRITTFSAVLIIGLLIASLSDNLTLGPVIGAFVAGILINHSNKDREEEQELVQELKLMVFSLVIPFFFINIGLNFNVENFGSNIWLAVLITLFAIIGKLLAAFAAKPFTSLSWAQAHLLGWVLNSRGAIELVIATLAFNAGVIPVEIFNAIVVMAIFTTLIFPFILKGAVARDRSILY